MELLSVLRGLFLCKRGLKFDWRWQDAMCVIRSAGAGLLLFEIHKCFVKWTTSKSDRYLEQRLVCLSVSEQHNSTSY